MPKKLEDCVSDVQRQGKSKSSAFGICVDSTGEKPHQEALNGNRQVPYYNPPLKTNKVEPKIDKTFKGKIGGTQNFMTSDVWKQILDAQLSRNVKNPRY